MIFYPKINFSRDEIDSTFILIRKKQIEIKTFQENDASSKSIVSQKFPNYIF